MRKMKMRSICAAMAVTCGMLLASCSDEEEKLSINQEVTETEMIVSGVWKTGEVIHLDRHLVIPEG